MDSSAGACVPKDDSGGYGQYTVEGESAQFGSFVSGANRRGGVLGGLAKVLCLLLLLLTLGGLIAVVAAWIFGGP